MVDHEGRDLTAGFVGYVLLALKFAPASSCGCLGKRQAPVSRQTLARAGLLLLLSIVGWRAEQFWLTAIVAHPWAIGIAAAEVLAFIGLSPELAWTRLPFRAARPRWGGAPPIPDCSKTAISLSDSLDVLRGSLPFQDLSPYLRSEMSDHWREGCWHFLSFAAEYADHKATAVFVVPISLLAREVRGAIVDDADGSVFVSSRPGDPRPMPHIPAVESMPV